MDKKRILIVEDEVSLAEMLKMRLDSQGYDAVTAYDGKTGYELAKKEKPDVIILDLMLPKMDGYKVCGLLKSDTRYKKIPILIFTAKAQAEDEKMAMDAGANAYITKPFEPQILYDKIKLLLSS